MIWAALILALLVLLIWLAFYVPVFRTVLAIAACLAVIAEVCVWVFVLRAQQMHEMVRIPLRDVEVVEMKLTPFGVHHRVAARVTNRSHRVLSALEVRFRLQSCAQRPCQVLSEQTAELIADQHIPPGHSADFLQLVRFGSGNRLWPRDCEWDYAVIAAWGE